MVKDFKTIAEEYSAAHAEETKNLLRTLAPIPSPSHHEERRSEFVCNWFKEQGFKNVRIDDAKNVICALGPDDDNLTVFAAHMDVVFPDTTPLPLEEHDGKMFGPGVGDDTANLCQLMICARYLRDHESELEHGVLIVGDACEEGLGNLDGTKALFAQYEGRIKAFYSIDGYTGGIANGGVGSHRYRVTCRTQGGHSWLNFGRENAIEKMCALIEDLYKMDVPTEARTTFNVGTFEGGTTINSIAQEASVLFEYRSASQDCLKHMKDQFDAAIAGHTTDSVKFSVELLGVRPGNGDLDYDALEKFTQHSIDVVSTFYDGEVSAKSSSTDSNIPLSMGVLANTIGAIEGDGEHTREEWIVTDSIDTGLKITLSMMLTTVL